MKTRKCFNANFYIKAYFLKVIYLFLLNKSIDMVLMEVSQVLGTNNFSHMRLLQKIARIYAMGVHIACASIECSDESAHPHSFARTMPNHILKVWL